MNVSIYDRQLSRTGTSPIEMTVEEMVSLAPELLPISERVAGVEGKAFDLKSWYGSLRRRYEAEGVEPTHLRVTAVDNFEAIIPWTQLDSAAILYAQENDLPLSKGYPIRLYVPNGSSLCLNVKSLVILHILYDDALGQEAEYGYRNEISLEALKTKK
jgi:hypothetical protein